MEICPECGGQLVGTGTDIRCTECGLTYEEMDDMLDGVENPDLYDNDEERDPDDESGFLDDDF